MKYEVRTVLNTFAWVEVEADSEEEAISQVMRKGWVDWATDTDWSNGSDLEAIAQE